MNDEEWNGYVAIVTPQIEQLEEAKKNIALSLISLGKTEVQRQSTAIMLKEFGVRKPRGGLNPEQQASLLKCQAAYDLALNQLAEDELLWIMDTPSRQGLTVDDHRLSWTRKVTKALKDAAKAEDA